MIFGTLFGSRLVLAKFRRHFGRHFLLSVYRASASAYISINYFTITVSSSRVVFVLESCFAFGGIFWFTIFSFGFGQVPPTLWSSFLAFSIPCISFSLYIYQLLYDDVSPSWRCFQSQPDFTCFRRNKPARGFQAESFRRRHDQSQNWEVRRRSPLL